MHHIGTETEKDAGHIKPKDDFCSRMEPDNKICCSQIKSLATRFPSKFQFFRSLHINYLFNVARDDSSLDAFFSQHLRMGGAYWAATALWSMGLSGCTCMKTKSCEECSHQIDNVPAKEKCVAKSPISDKNVDSSDLNCSRCQNFGFSLSCEMRKLEEYLLGFIRACRQPCGAYGPAPGHDAHVTSTHYALLLLTGLGKINEVDRDGITTWIKSLQEPHGGFRGDEWGEVDSRFVYCSIASLSLLHSLTRDVAENAVCFIQSLKNFDAGFAWVPGGESHAASAFCCVAALSLCEGLWIVNRRELALWLLDRQTEGGGFNGRPEKAPDVCYSFWIVATLCIIGYDSWVDKERLTEFVLMAQDTVQGGVADRPEDVGDVFHTFFGIAALGLMGTVEGIEMIHPIISLPNFHVKNMGLPGCVWLDSK